VSDNEVQISHGLSKGVKFRLKHVELTNGSESFVEVGDFRELIHVLSNVAHNLGIIDALVAQPFPDHEEFAMRTIFSVIESGGTAVQDSNGEMFLDQLNGSVRIRFSVTTPFPHLGQLRFHGRSELSLGKLQDGFHRWPNCIDFGLLLVRGLGHFVLKSDETMLVHWQQTGFPNHVTIREHPGGFLQGVFVLSFEDNQEIVEMRNGIGLEDV
jgi:hypothetical protein